MSSRILECVPNFSEGRNPEVIDRLRQSIMSVPGVDLHHIDRGMATNRSVFTFTGEPEAVAESAFRAIKTASELIDMRIHRGEHPRIGATDVCPLIPLQGISVKGAIEISQELGKRVGDELNIPVYLYEFSASSPVRRYLANIRSGQYESFPLKMERPDWKPDFGPHIINPSAGATVIGARRI